MFLQVPIYNSIIVIQNEFDNKVKPKPICAVTFSPDNTAGGFTEFKLILKQKRYDTRGDKRYCLKESKEVIEEKSRPFLEQGRPPPYLNSIYKIELPTLSELLKMFLDIKMFTIAEIMPFVHLENCLVLALH